MANHSGFSFATVIEKIYFNIYRIISNKWLYILSNFEQTSLAKIVLIRSYIAYQRSSWSQLLCRHCI